MNKIQGVLNEADRKKTSFLLRFPLTIFLL